MSVLNMVYVLKATEYEQGLGSRPDGFVCFNTEAESKVFLEKVLLEKENATRAGPVPNIYIHFDEVGLKEANELFSARCEQYGKVWITNLSELN